MYKSLKYEFEELIDIGNVEYLTTELVCLVTEYY